MIFFALPYLFFYFLQTLYGMADLFIVGQFDTVVSTTTASIGSQVMHMITVMIVGLAMGSTVIIARNKGAKKEENVSISIAMESLLKKQKELIGKFHELGCEVLMSAHIGKVMPKEETLALAREIESRGADIVKIIANAKDEEELCIVLCTINYLKNNLKTPFLYQACGKYGKFVRPTAFMFGSCIVLCNDEIYEMSNPEKPLMRDVNKIKRLLMWED